MKIGGQCPRHILPSQCNKQLFQNPFALSILILYPQHGMLVISAVNGQHNFHANVTQHRPHLGQWTNVEILQAI